MEVLAINGSARKDGNTALLINTVFEELNKEGIETEMVQFSGKIMEPCKACWACSGKKNCVHKKDQFQEIFEKMTQADGIILGSPVYTANMSANMQALLERASVVTDMNRGENLFAHKVGAAVTAARRGGALSALDSMNHFFMLQNIATGTTEPLAEYAAEILEADIYEIMPEVPYTETDLAYYTNGRADQEQNDPSARPAIAGKVENMEEYDTIILGYPIWHGQAPRIISTFLESYDFSEKTIIPFCTSHSPKFRAGISAKESTLEAAAYAAIQSVSKPLIRIFICHHAAAITQNDLSYLSTCRTIADRIG